MGQFLAKKLYETLERREENLVNHTTLIAALYLDPRFHCTLSSQKKEFAIKHLKSVFDHAEFLQPCSNLSHHISFIPQSPKTSTSSSNSTLESTSTASSNIENNNLPCSSTNAITDILTTFQNWLEKL